MRNYLKYLFVLNLILISGCNNPNAIKSTITEDTRQKLLAIKGVSAVFASGANGCDVHLSVYPPNNPDTIKQQALTIVPVNTTVCADYPG